MVTGPPSLLTIMAHPDDGELWAGGTIAAHVEAGGNATIALPRHDTTRMAEARRGAELLQARLHMMNALTAADVETLLAQIQPDVLITHPPDDIHPDHRACAEAVLAAIPNAVIRHGHPHRLYHCDGYNNLDRHGDPLHLPTLIDVSTQWPLKIEALTAHVSQPIENHFAPMAETLGRLHGQRGGCRHAEGFRPLPILGALPVAATL